ncbi:MAG: hypothetical protein CL763_10020 [Chloroflexi bacterium]|nr:hypothetical protein [Chloroflexota bacterium]|tara:strand:+ start:9793 stop:10323 length:531 start_codon:yes stop_codon:yes gene_type:complete
MSENIGEILQFGVSGRDWEGKALDIRRMFFDFLKSARKSIVISAFSLGGRNDDMKTFFEIIEEKLIEGIQIRFIVNADENLKKFSKEKLEEFDRRFKHFTFQKVNPKRDGKDTNKLLHAKITIVDREYGMLGSANISRNALENNYEIMLKIKGKTVTDIHDLIINLSNTVESGQDY